MVDYYSVLLRAVTAPGAGDAQWRRDIYDRSRQMLTARMHGLRPQPPLTQIAAEEAKLEAAIERVEAELAWTETARNRRPRPNRTVVVPPPGDQIDDAAASEDEPLEFGPEWARWRGSQLPSSWPRSAPAAISSFRARSPRRRLATKRKARRCPPPLCLKPPRHKKRPRRILPPSTARRTANSPPASTAALRSRPALCVPPATDLLPHAATGRHHHRRQTAALSLSDPAQ